MLAWICGGHLEVFCKIMCGYPGIQGSNAFSLYPSVNRLGYPLHLQNRLSSVNKHSQNLSFLNQHRFILTSRVHYGSCGDFSQCCLRVWTHTDRELPSGILLVNVIDGVSVLRGVLHQHFNGWTRINICHLCHIVPCFHLPKRQRARNTS